MDQQGPNHSNVRRITLPSGRSIEVVKPAQAGSETRLLHVCPACESELVQPVSWREVDDSSWQLSLECPNCSWCEEGVYPREQVDQLEDRMDDGLCEMLADLQRLAQANMVDEVERFIAALNADQVLPEDF